MNSPFEDLQIGSFPHVVLLSPISYGFGQAASWPYLVILHMDQQLVLQKEKYFVKVHESLKELALFRNSK